MSVTATILRFCWLLALLLFVFEFAELTRRLWLPEAWKVRGAVGLVLLAKTLVLLAPACLIAWVAACLGYGRLGLRLAVIWGVSLSVYAAADLIAHARTGNHLSFYIAYLKEEEIGRWGGDLETAHEIMKGRMVPFVATVGGSLGLGILTWRARTRSTRGLFVLTTAAALVCLGSLAVQRALPRAILFESVNRAMIVPWNAGFSLGRGAQTELEQELRTIYQRDHSAILSSLVPRAPPETLSPTISPDIVIVLCDSLRQASFDPETMPRVFRWSEQGVRFTRSYAVGNTTPVGMYALLHGYYPFLADRTTQAERPIPWVQVLRRAGYDAVLFQGYRSWSALDGVLNKRDFWLEPIETGSNWERDRDAVESAKKLLSIGGRPRLVIVHLVSTHHVYSYPPQPRYQDYQPDPDAVMRGFFSDYHRSARYLDDLVGAWLEEIDLERSIVIFTSDHGESLGEDGSYFHGSAFSDVQRRIPLVIAGPGVPRGKVVDSIVESVDVVPTLLSLLGLDELNSSLHGRARLPPPMGEPNYAALFRAPHRGRGKARELVLVGPEARFMLILGVEEPTLELRGRLGPTLNELPTPVDLAQSEQILRWFRNLLRRTAGITAENS